jgi:hypothetical protein
VDSAFVKQQTKKNIPCPLLPPLPPSPSLSRSTASHIDTPVKIEKSPVVKKRSSLFNKCETIVTEKEPSPPTIGQMTSSVYYSPSSTNADVSMEAKLCCSVKEKIKMFQKSNPCPKKPPLPNSNAFNRGKLNKSISPVRDFSSRHRPPILKSSSAHSSQPPANKENFFVVGGVGVSCSGGGSARANLNLMMGAPFAQTHGVNSGGNYLPKQKWIINEEQAVVVSPRSSFRREKDNSTASAKKHHLSISNMVVNFKDFKNTSLSIESLNAQFIEKNEIVRGSGGRVVMMEESSSADAESIEFKSVRERIEYFQSGRLLSREQRAATMANLSQHSFGRSSQPAASAAAVETPSLVSCCRSASHCLNNASFRSSMMNVAKVLEKRKCSMLNLEELESFRFAARPSLNAVCGGGGGGKNDLCQM